MNTELGGLSFKYQAVYFNKRFPKITHGSNLIQGYINL